MFADVSAWNPAGMIVMIIGVALILSEVFVSSHGVLGVLGVAGLWLGAEAFMEPGKLASILREPVLLAVAAGAVIFGGLAVRLAVSARRHKIVSGREAMIGAVARVLNWKDAGGHVLIQGERWRATGRLTEPRGSVEIVGIDGLILMVRPIAAEYPTHGFPEPGE